MNVRATYIGGPTALLEIDRLRLLTDPTFDPAGTSYETPVYTLRRTQGPALTPEAIGKLDAVLLSHDHHFDNLDRAGRAMLANAARILTTPAGAERLGGNAVGLALWESTILDTADGRGVRITGTPARHGPPGGDRGPVTGFLINSATNSGAPSVYISGDTVWYEGMEEIARRADVRIAFLFMGAARVREVGQAHLTLTASEGVLAARAMPSAVIVPLHYEGWQHFSEGRAEIERAFTDAGLADRLRWLAPGEPVAFGEVTR